MSDRTFTVVLERKLEIDVVADDMWDAMDAVKEMYENGDASAELGDPKISVRLIKKR